MERGPMFRARKVILLIAPTRAFDRGLLQGIARYANERGPWTFYREPPHYQAIDWKKKVTDRLSAGQVDGIIMREPERIEEIIRRKIPGICAPVTRRTIEGFINIIIDNDAVGTLGAEHLLVETDLAVAQVAEKLCFSSAKQLDRVFTRFQGTTPTAYRLRHSLR